MVGATTVFSADTGIFDEVSSSADIISTSLLGHTSFLSLVLATDNKVCDDPGELVCVGVSVISVTLEDGTFELSEKPRLQHEPHQRAKAAAEDREPD